MATGIEYPGNNAQAEMDLNAKIASLLPANTPAPALLATEAALDALYIAGVALHNNGMNDGGYTSTAAITAFDQIETATTIVGVEHAIGTLYTYGLII